MVNTKNHHFLPQFYLRGFSSGGTPKKRKKIWTISKAATPGCVEDLVRNVGREEHFHTITTPDGATDSDSIEGQLSRLETHFADVRTKIVKGDTVNATDRHLLSRFVCLMKMRQPALKNFINHMRSAGADAMMRLLLVGDRLEAVLSDLPQYKQWPTRARVELTHRIRRAVAEGRIGFTNSNASLLHPMFATAFDEELMAIYDSMTLEVFEAPNGCAFITGDQPVVRFDPTPPDPSIPGTGLTHPDVEVTFPLSVSKLLRFSWKHSPTERLVTAEEVNEFNRRTVVSAKRVLFASTCDDHILQIIRANHARFAGTYFIPLPLNDGRTLTLSRCVPVRSSQYYLS